jgi:DNA-binding NarL/FixJ family response regulator
MNKIAVLLVDDHAVVRQGLRVLLEVEGDMVVVGEAENGHEAVVLARKTLPDVVVMDVAMLRG